MVNINIKVKTIDGVDNSVSVDDELPLAEFRTVIENVTSIEKESQRVIFRGKPLTDDGKTLKSYGLESEMAIHVVKRTPGSRITISSALQSESNTTNTFDEQQHSHVTSRNIIMGTVPLERTALFHSPEQTLEMIRSVLDHFCSNFNGTSEANIQNNLQNINDFSISVLIRGQRDSVVNSPARERFEQLKRDMIKLAWMVATVKILFNRYIDDLFAQGFVEPSESDTCSIIAEILQGMHIVDVLEIEELRTLHAQEDSIDPLLRTADEIDLWQLPNDEAHHQRMDNSINMRHVVSSDLAMLLTQLEKIDSHINNHLMGRYIQILGITHTYETASYTARLLNCFTSAISRIQHFRAHLYHSISDFGIHVDLNPLNRVFPQYIIYEREDPPEANVTFLFRYLTNYNNNINDSTVQTNINTTTNVNTNNSSNTNLNLTTNTNTGNRVVSSIQQFLQRAGASFLGSNPPNNRPTNITNPHSNVSLNISIDDADNFPNSIDNTIIRGIEGYRMPLSSQGQTGLGLGFMSGPISGVRISTRHSQPLQTQFLSNNNVQPMDTSTGPPNQPNRINFVPQPQSMNLGQALSEFVSLASQLSGNSGNERFSVLQNSSQSIRNRSNSSLVNQSINNDFRRSNSTSRLSGNANIQQNQIRTLPPFNSPLHLSTRQAPRLIAHSNSNSSALIGWRQLPSNSPTALFVGLRPPISMPLFTNDPYLPCSSRRLRNFDMDARHSDFWNDPATIASGRRLRRFADTSNMDTDMSSTNTAQSGNQNENSSTSNSRNCRNMSIRVNANGEAIFTDEHTFREYVLGTFEQVALSMQDLTPNSLSRQRQSNQSRSFFSDYNSQVYGYTPVMGRSILGGLDSTTFDAPHIEGIISITADIQPRGDNPLGTNDESETTLAARNENSQNLVESQNNSINSNSNETNSRQSEFRNDLDEMD